MQFSSKHSVRVRGDPDDVARPLQTPFVLDSLSGGEWSTGDALSSAPSEKLKAGNTLNLHLVDTDGCMSAACGYSAVHNSSVARTKTLAVPQENWMCQQLKHKVT